MKPRINYTQSFYSIVDQEIERFFEKENIIISDSKATTARIIDLFFKTIGIKQYNDTDQIMTDILDHVKIPIILAKEYAKLHNMPDEHLIIKAIDNMQTRIKEYISHPPALSTSTTS